MSHCSANDRPHQVQTLLLVYYQFRSQRLCILETVAGRALWRAGLNAGITQLLGAGLHPSDIISRHVYCILENELALDWAAVRETQRRIGHWVVYGQRPAEENKSKVVEVKYRKW